MYAENLENLFKTNRNLTGPLGDWSKRWSELCRHATQQNLELASESLSRLSHQLKRCGNIEKPEDLLKCSKEFFNEDISAAIDLTHKTMRNYMNNMEHFAKYYSSIKDTAIHAVEKHANKVERTIKNTIKKKKKKKKV